MGTVVGLGLGLIPPCSLFLDPQTTLESGVVIYVYGDAAHTNILVPVKTPSFNWQEQLPLGPGREYVGFGWGERELYRQLTPLAEIPPDVALRALLLAHSPATLHVQEFDQVPQAPLAEFLISLELSPADYQALTQYLLNSFERDPQGDVIWLNQSRQVHSNFYAATGSYSAWFTCNSWTARALHQANIQPPLWDTLSIPLIYHLHWFKTCRSWQATLMP